MKKRFFSFLTALTVGCIGMPVLPAHAENRAGAFGDVKWVLSGDTMTFSGTGTLTIPDDAEFLEWEGFRNDVRHLILEEGITAVTSNYFVHMPVETVSLPDSLTKLCYGFFMGCRSMETVRLPANLETLPAQCFESCSSLQSIEIPDSVTTMEPYCFHYCESLTQVSAPDHMRIMSGAFEGCYKVLTMQEKMGILDGKYIVCYDPYIPPENSGVEPVSTATWYEAETPVAISESDTDAPMHLVLPDGIRGIADEAFHGVNNLYSVTLPETCTIIGAYAFNSCADLRSINLPEGITQIHDYTFASCTNLVTADIPSTVTSIGRAAFQGCHSLQALVLPDGLTEIGISAFSGCSELTELIIPDSITKLPSSVFSDCENLQRVTLPETLTVIESYAFNGCRYLTEINIPASIFYVGRNCFGSGTMLESEHTEHGFFVMGHVLFECSNLNHVLQVPEEVTVIAANVFRESRTLESITLSDGVETIHPYDFLDCRNLMRVEMGKGLRTIENECFTSCIHLAEVVLNDGLETIMPDAFRSCPQLKTLTIPASVTYIGHQSGLALTTIYGVAGTAAEDYARQNNIDFIEIQEATGGDMTLDYAKDGFSFGNNGTAFGTTYYLRDADMAMMPEIMMSTAEPFYEKNWSGSCFGLSVAVILAKNGEIPLETLQRGAASLSDLTVTPQLISMLNTYHALQFSADYSRLAIRTDTPVLLLSRIRNMATAIKTGGSPFLMTYATTTGSHAVVGYGIEQGEWTWDDRAYDTRILLWDSNFPAALQDKACLYCNSSSACYCIPYYGLFCDGSAESSFITSLCNNVNALLSYPYPHDTMYDFGDLNHDGQVSIGDGILMARLLTEQPDALPQWKDCRINCNGDGCFDLDDLCTFLTIMKKES